MHDGGAGRRAGCQGNAGGSNDWLRGRMREWPGSGGAAGWGGGTGGKDWLQAETKRLADARRGEARRIWEPLRCK